MIIATKKEIENNKSAKWIELFFSPIIVGGYAKNNSNTLLFMQYYFESDIYRDLKKLFDLRKTYYAEKNAGKRANKKIFKEIKKSALDINLSLTKTLNDLSNINFIEEYHYTYYRILQILSNLIIPEKKAIECKRMLECPKRIENHLKTAQRNGILGSLFTGKMYCFYNEHIIKSLIVVHNFWMFILAANTGHNIIHDITQCHRQIMGFPKTQHFCEISLWVNIHKKNFFAVHRKTSAEVIHSSAFPNTAFLICYGNYFWFHRGSPF